jgi:hypothetical protein
MPRAVTVDLGEPAPAALAELARAYGRIAGLAIAEGRWDPVAAVERQAERERRDAEARQLAEARAARRDVYAAPTEAS